MIKFFLNYEPNKKTEKSPDYWGYADVNGVRHKAAGWLGENPKGSYVSVQLTPEVDMVGHPVAQAAPPPPVRPLQPGTQPRPMTPTRVMPPQRQLPSSDLDDEIPF